MTRYIDGYNNSIKIDFDKASTIISDFSKLSNEISSIDRISSYQSFSRLISSGLDSGFISNFDNKINTLKENIDSLQNLLNNMLNNIKETEISIYNDMPNDIKDSNNNGGNIIKNEFESETTEEKKSIKQLNIADNNVEDKTLIDDNSVISKKELNIMDNNFTSYIKELSVDDLDIIANKIYGILKTTNINGRDLVYNDIYSFVLKDLVLASINKNSKLISFINNDTNNTQIIFKKILELDNNTLTQEFGLTDSQVVIINKIREFINGDVLNEDFS